MALICKECGSQREKGRKLCRACNVKRVSRYPRYKWSKQCEACSLCYLAHRKNQRVCLACYTLLQETKANSRSTNKYVFTNKPGRTKHRDLAESLLGRKLLTNEVVHHVNDDPRDNRPENLMVLSRTMHGRLHSYLDLQRVILEKSGIENFENCWNTLIAPMTTAWLETTSAKVIKLWEIGQSAAEPLSNGEGSETMHETSATGYAVDDDIVQTTTERVSES